MIATPEEVELVRVAKASALRCLNRGRPTAGPLDVAMLLAATEAAHADGRAPTGIVTLLSEIHQATRKLTHGLNVFGSQYSRRDLRRFAARCVDLCERVEAGDAGRYAWRRAA